MFQKDSSTHGIRRYLSLRRGKNNTSCGLKAYSAADTRILAAALEQAKKKKNGNVLKFNPADMGPLCHR